MDRVTAARHCSSAVRTCDNASSSKMNCLSQWMMSVRQTRSRRSVGSSTNSRDRNVGVDCSALDRVWALYSVDGLLSYELWFIFLLSVLLFFQSFSVFIYEGTDVWLLVEIINILMSFVSFYGNGEFKARSIWSANCWRSCDSRDFPLLGRFFR